MPVVVIVVWVAAVITVIIQGGIKYAKQHISKSDRT
jgi:hypothetical protein